MSLRCVNVESSGLFKTLILIHWFHRPKRNKNIRWTLRRLGLLSFTENANRLLNLTVLHLWTAIFRFHHANHLLFAASFGYWGAVIAWVVIGGCFDAGHLIIINCLWWQTFIFIRRTWLTTAVLPLFILISWAREIRILGMISHLRSGGIPKSLAMLWRGSRDLELV